MSIEKDIAIHGLREIESVISYIKDEKNGGEKLSVESYLAERFGIYDVDNMTDEEIALVKRATSGVESVLSYAENIEKTAFELDGEKNLLVSGIGCGVQLAAIAFQRSRELYYKKKRKAALVEHLYVDKNTGEVRSKQSVECYHVIQSFPEYEGLNPLLVHQAGIEYAKRAFPGHRCVVTTHMNTNHLHNHIVVCAYHESGLRKFSMNMTKRREIRHINDQISIEFGLPILLESDLDRRTSVSHLEWEAKCNGSLWKDRYRNDIRNIADSARSWNEFVSVMRQAGYQVNDNGKYVTYHYLTPDPDDTRNFRKIRDVTLGYEFARDELIAEHGWNTGYEKTVTHHVQRNVRDKEPNFTVDRYSPDGRRRSDLELVFLMAIKIIRYFKDLFLDRVGAERSPDNPIYKPYGVRMQAMQHAAFMVRELGLDNQDQLYERLNVTGSQLSHARKELESIEKNLEFLQVITDKIKVATVARVDALEISYDISDLKLHETSEEQIFARRAEEMPMTPKMRQELHIKLNDNPQWKPKYDYSCISYPQAQEIMAFLSGKTHEKPDCLIPLAEFKKKRMAKMYADIAEKKDQNLKQKYSETPMTPAMVRKLEIIKAQEGLNIDIDTLSMYDGMKVIGYFENRENHYGPEQSYITSDQREKLERLLSDRGYSMARKTGYVLKSEYDALINYLETGKGKLPDLLKPDNPIRESDRKQIEELLEIKGEFCVIPPEELTQLDGQKFMTYLLTKDTVPDILKKHVEVDPNTQRDIDFANSMFERPLYERPLLEKYRNILNDLMEYGIDPDNTDEILSREKALTAVRDMLKAQVDGLSKEYRELKRIDTGLQLARTPQFTYGPLFTKDELALADNIEIREELDKEPDVPVKIQAPEREPVNGLEDILSLM